MSKSSAKFLIVSGDKFITEFMQCSDVFEKSKVIGVPKIVTINFKKDEKVSLKRMIPLIEANVKALEASKEIVSLVHLIEVQNNNTIIRNMGEIAPYVNREVRCISDGKSWSLFSKYIESSTGLDVITDQHMFIVVVGVSIKPDGFKTIMIKK